MNSARWTLLHKSVTGLLLAIGTMTAVLADTEQYTYDALGRLKTVNSSSGSAITYNYDAAGNRTSVASQGPTVPVLNLSCASPTLPTQPVAATQTCTLSNTGPVGASSISYGAITGVTISGPTGACAANATCGAVTLTSGTSAGPYTGTLTATPNTGIAASVTVNLVVNPPGVQPVLTLSCASSTPQSTPTAATTTCTLGNTGNAAASGITYTVNSATVGMSASGPATCAAGSTNCGVVNVSSGTGANTYSGSVTAAPGNGGTAGSANVTLVVNPTFSLSRSPNPMLAERGYTVNWSSAGATSIGFVCTSTGTGYSGSGSLPSMTGSSVGTASKYWVGYPSSCVWTANGPGGTSVTLNETLTTNDPPPALALSCTFNSPTITPTAASADCTLSNNGGYAASLSTTSVPAGVSLSGMPANCPRFNNCGVIKLVTTSTAAYTSVSGNLTIKPDTGTSATTSITLQVNPTAPALTLSCTSNSPQSTPTKATATCTVGNNGGTQATGITYTPPTGVTISGAPVTCAANTGSCLPSFTVTSGSGADNYTGTLTATPGNGGSSGSTTVNLVVNPTITVGRNPNPMVATQQYTTSWSTVGATSAGFSCTSTGTGYSGSGSLSPLTSSSVGTALAAWVGYPSTCVWTANGPNGTKATFSETLNTVYPPPAFTLSCTTNSPTIAPTAATATCTVGNANGGPASSISYSTPVGMTASGGPTTCGAFATNCGTVTVSTSTSVGGPYTGQVTATPNAGSAGSANLTLQVIQGSGTFAFVSGTHTAPGTIGDIATATIRNSGNAAITSITFSCTSGAYHNASSPVASLAAGATATFACQSHANPYSPTTGITLSGTGASNSPFTVSF